MAEHDDVQSQRLLLPFYLNDTLAPAERARIDAWLTQDAAAREELQFVRMLAQAMRQPAAERAPLQGYEQLAVRLVSRRPARAAWWQRLLTLEWAPVATLTLVLVSLQIGWNVWRVHDDAGNVVYRGAAQASRGADLKLVVRRDSRFADLVELLAQNRCHVVWGPSISGELWIALDQPADAELTRQRLVRSSLVEDAMLLGTR